MKVGLGSVVELPRRINPLMFEVCEVDEEQLWGAGRRLCSLVRWGERDVSGQSGGLFKG